MDSVLQICKTLFILIVLGVGALLFSADANRLVLIPVDRMVQRVKNIADNPRHKVSSGDQAFTDPDGAVYIVSWPSSPHMQYARQNFWSIACILDIFTELCDAVETWRGTFQFRWLWPGRY